MVPLNRYTQKRESAGLRGTPSPCLTLPESPWSSCCECPGWEGSCRGTESALQTRSGLLTMGRGPAPRPHPEGLPHTQGPGIVMWMHFCAFWSRCP